MAWSWSHSHEAYDNAYANVQGKDREWLKVVYAEWRATERDEDGFASHFDEELYEQALKDADDLSDDELSDYIWMRMDDQALCDNGGFNAWCCPDGCHTVSFDPEENIL